MPKRVDAVKRQKNWSGYDRQTSQESMKLIARINSFHLSLLFRGYVTSSLGGYSKSMSLAKGGLELAKKITKYDIGGEVGRSWSLVQKNMVSKILYQLINMFYFHHSIVILMQLLI